MDSKYIIVNNEAGSAVVDAFCDLAGYIDTRNKSSDLEPVAEDFRAACNVRGSVPATTQPSFEKLARNADALLKSPPSEFEGAFNLLWYVLSSAPNFGALVPEVLAVLAKNVPATHTQQLALMGVLANLFNIVDLPQKPVVFSHIVNLAIKANAAHQLVPQLAQLAEWLREWQYSKTEELLVELVDGISGSDKEVIAFLTKVVSAFSQSQVLATLLVRKALESTQDVSLDALLTLEGVNSLDNELLACLRAIAEGDFAAFSNLSSEHSQNKQLVNKAQVTAVARLAATAINNELKYSAIAETVQVPEQQVEPIIVECVKSGLVKGRMNQLTSTFAIESATVVGPVTEHHWDIIDERLHSWKRSLEAVLDVSSKAKNNRDVVKALKKLEVHV